MNIDQVLGNLANAACPIEYELATQEAIETINALQAELTKALAIPAGYVLVPLVPNAAIIAAGGGVISKLKKNAFYAANVSYTAMIKAAQQERN